MEFWTSAASQHWLLIKIAVVATSCALMECLLRINPTHKVNLQLHLLMAYRRKSSPLLFPSYSQKSIVRISLSLSLYRIDRIAKGVSHALNNTITLFPPLSLNFLQTSSMTSTTTSSLSPHHPHHKASPPSPQVQQPVSQTPQLPSPHPPPSPPTP